MNSSLIPPIPLETMKAAHALYGCHHIYLIIGDQVDNLFSGLVEPEPGHRAERLTLKFATLSLITAFQFMETIPDQQVPDAIRMRLDWKYALHLPVYSPDLDSDSLCQFRQELLKNPGRYATFRRFVLNLNETLDMSGRPCSYMEASQMLWEVCTVSRMAKTWLTFNQALEALATQQPDLLLKISLPHWYNRYSRQQIQLSLLSAISQRDAFIQSMGKDGHYLMKEIAASSLPALEQLPEISTLKHVWQEQYIEKDGILFWRKRGCLDRV